MRLNTTCLYKPSGRKHSPAKGIASTVTAVLSTALNMKALRNGSLHQYYYVRLLTSEWRPVEASGEGELRGKVAGSKLLSVARRNTTKWKR